MNRHEYLRILSERLNGLPYDEYNNIIEYYTEYFEEAGEENEAGVIEELGRPDILAEKIIRESAGKGQDINMSYSQSYPNVYGDSCSMNYTKPTQKKEGLSTGWKVVIAIISFPVLIALFGVVFGFATAALSCFFAGICTVATSIVAMTSTVPAGIFFMGAGFIILAVALGFLAATVGIATGCGKFIKYIYGKNKSTV